MLWTTPQVWMPTGDHTQEHRAHGAVAWLPRGTPQTLLMQGNVVVLWSGSWLGPSRWRERHSFFPAASIPALWLHQSIRVCTATLRGLGRAASTPTSSLKVLHVNVHRFCQQLCGVPAWGRAPPAPWHWAPHSLWEVLALHISGQERQGMQEDGPCLGAPFLCLGWAQGVCPRTGPAATGHAGGMDHPKEERRGGCTQSCAGRPRPSQL